jgi:hypothetical protein
LKKLDKERLQLIETFDCEWRVKYPEELNKNYDKFYEALEVMDSNPIRGEIMLKSLIRKYPDVHIDAYTHLGDSYVEQLKFREGRRLIRKAFSISKSLVPSRFNSFKQWT